MQIEIKREKLPRIVRLERRHRGCLRCEWCNRWTEATPEYYEQVLSNGNGKAKGDQAKRLRRAQNWKTTIFLCKRPVCVQARKM